MPRDRLHPHQERTCVLIKPDAVRRGLIGEIIHRFEQRGLKVVALSMVEPGRKFFDKHYPRDKVWIRRLGEKTLETYRKYGFSAESELGTADPLKIGQMVRGWLVDFMVSGPIVKMIVEGVHAIDMVRKLAGHTMPYLAEMGTIRGDFSADSPAVANRERRAVRNLIHASETPEEAAWEISLWFNEAEIHDSRRTEEEL